jgi:hypothetical protein
MSNEQCIPQRLLTGLTGFTGFRVKPGESNPVHPVHPVEKAQRHSAAHIPIPSEIHPFSHVVRRVWDGCVQCAMSNQQGAINKAQRADCPLLIAHCSLPISGCCVERARTIFLP